MDKKPNILFILTDDQRYNTIHALGNAAIITPNMDRLTARGVSFTQAHIPGGTSGAICMPSRAMLLTGRTLFHLQQEGQDIPGNHKMLGEAFREAGFFCYGTGKWHNGPPAFSRCFQGGDQIFFGGMWDHWNVPTNYYDPAGEYDNVINFVSNFQQSNAAVQVHCDQFNPGKHSSELLTDTAISFIRQQDRRQPFLLYTAYLAPHDPRTMPEKYRNLYDPEKIDLPDNYMAAHPFDFGISDIRDETLAAYPRDESEIKKHLAEYYGMITHLDSEIGRLIAAVDEKGELDNTIIVLAGDNGLAVGCHGLMGKQNHYDHSIRVPLILAGPGIPVNQRREQYVYLLDVFPTLCDLVGIPVPDSVEGRSFAGMFRDPSAVTRRQLYFAYNDLIRSVKDEQYKLIEYRGVARKTQLFDLRSDPSEMNNLAEDPRYLPTLKHLRICMEDFRDQWDDGKHSLGKTYWQDKGIADQGNH